MITFVCWKWSEPNYRTKFTAEHANVWNAGIRRHYGADCRTICVTDDPEGVRFETFPLWHDLDDVRNPSGSHLPRCYRRLKIFSRYVTSEMDIAEGDPVVSLDLDVVFVRSIRPMFSEIEDFKGWRGVGSFQPVVYNGTLFQFRAGRAEFLWTDFDPATSPGLANRERYFGSDQGWISYRLDGCAPGWSADDGILSFSSDLHPNRQTLPSHARIVSFNGKRKPWDDYVQQESPWIKNYWRL